MLTHESETRILSVSSEKSVRLYNGFIYAVRTGESRLRARRRRARGRRADGARHLLFVDDMLAATGGILAHGIGLRAGGVHAVFRRLELDARAAVGSADGSDPSLERLRVAGGVVAVVLQLVAKLCMYHKTIGPFSLLCIWLKATATSTGPADRTRSGNGIR